jgi:hypothetical protein
LRRFTQLNPHFDAIPRRWYTTMATLQLMDSDTICVAEAEAHAYIRPSSIELNSLQSELELELHPRTNTRHWQLVASTALALLLLTDGVVDTMLEGKTWPMERLPDHSQIA